MLAPAAALFFKSNERLCISAFSTSPVQQIKAKAEAGIDHLKHWTQQNGTMYVFSLWFWTNIIQMAQFTEVDSSLKEKTKSSILSVYFNQWVKNHSRCSLRWMCNVSNINAHASVVTEAFTYDLSQFTGAMQTLFYESDLFHGSFVCYPGDRLVT